MRCAVLVTAAAALLAATALAAAPEKITVNGRSADVVVIGPNTLRITLDNGTAFDYEQEGNASRISGPPGANADLRVAEAVVEQWRAHHPGQSFSAPQATGNPGRFLFGLIAIGSGLLGTIKPEWAWYLRDGWRFRDAEPSDIALVVIRGGGVLALVIGLVVLFV